MSVQILVVDDSLMVRQQVSRALAGEGFSIVEACDGLDAQQKLAASPDVRLIVCDVNMPNMNGLEFLEKLAADGVKTPVVMLTTEGQPDLIRKAKALGAKGWLVKPFKPEFLAATAKKLAPLSA